MSEYDKVCIKTAGYTFQWKLINTVDSQLFDAPRGIRIYFE